MKNILIVEDDKKLNDGILLALKGYDFNFYQCRTLKDAWEEQKKRELHLILLDMNLPDGNGLDFLVRLRKGSNVPVIIITINNMETDIVLGLEYGANDYITKPFSLMVLRARVGVQLRQQIPEKSQRFLFDDFDFDFEKMKFLLKGESIELSKTEQRLLRILLENKGNTLTRNTLIDQVWSGDTEYVDEHALTVAIKRLRDKLEADSTNPHYIKTVYGIGYTWVVS